MILRKILFVHMIVAVTSIGCGKKEKDDNGGNRKAARVEKEYKEKLNKELARRDSVEKQREKLKTRVKELETASPTVASEAELNEARTKLAQAEAQLKESASKLNLFMKSQGETATIEAAIDFAITQTRAEIEAVNKQIAEKQAQVEAQTKTLAKADADIALLEKPLAEIAESLKAEATIAELEPKVKAYYEAKANFESSEEALTLKKTEVEKATAELDQLKQKQDTLKGDVGALTKEKESLSKKIVEENDPAANKELVDRLEVVETKIRLTNAEVESLGTQIIEKGKVVADLDAQLKQAQEKRDAAKKQWDDQTSALSGASADQLKAAMTTKTQSKEALDKAAGEVVTLETVLANKQEELKRYEDFKKEFDARFPKPEAA